MSTGYEYQLAVAPFVSKLQMAVTFGDSVTLDPTACKSLATVLSDLSKKMDMTVALMEINAGAVVPCPRCNVAIRAEGGHLCGTCGRDI
jgi:hypothetical protein